MSYAPLLYKQARERTDDIPITKENRIIFHRTGEGFDFGLYTASITDGKLSREEVQQALLEIEKTIRSTQNDPPFEYYCFAALAYFVLFLISVPLILYFFGTANCLAGLGGVGALWGGVWCYHRADEIKMQLIMNVVGKYNLRITVTGWKWVLLQHNPRWIELHKLGLNEDQEMQENNSE